MGAKLRTFEKTFCCFLNFYSATPVPVKYISVRYERITFVDYKNLKSGLFTLNFIVIYLRKIILITCLTLSQALKSEALNIAIQISPKCGLSNERFEYIVQTEFVKAAKARFHRLRTLCRFAISAFERAIRSECIFTSTKAAFLSFNSHL